MRISALAIAALLAAAPAGAAESAWQELAPGVSMRLISTGVVDPAGTTMMALELDMPQSTKTYWRVPGETGLPLEIDLGNSSAVGSYQVHWPYPEREDAGGYTDYVYHGHTILPLEVAVVDPLGLLELVATLGVCSDICIPAQAELSLPLVDAAPDRTSGLRIKQALAEVPIPWDVGEEPIGSIEALPDAIAVSVDGQALDTQSLIAATATGDVLFGAPQKSPQPGLVLLPILGKSDNSALDGLEVELTFMTERGAYAVTRRIGAATAY